MPYLSSTSPLTAGDIVNLAATIEQRSIPADAAVFITQLADGWQATIADAEGSDD